MAKLKITQLPVRQRIRKAVLLLSFLLFPIIINYFSPYVIIASAAEGIINGSFIVFALMLLSALLFGRIWCGWLCPAGGIQELCFSMNNAPVRGGKFNWIKWILVWLPWIAVIAFMAMSAGGYKTVNFFYMSENIVSIDEPARYIIYYVVIAIIVIPALLFGRRASCHYLCWMAPFMIIGRKIRNIFGWHALRLKADADKCIDCQKCTAECAMSLNVNQMVRTGKMEDAECILCGNCVDVCPKDVIKYTFSAGK